MPLKRSGYIVPEADIIEWAHKKVGKKLSEMGQPWIYKTMVCDAFDAHPKDLKESFDEVFPDNFLTITSVPSKDEPGKREAMYFFVRAAGDPNFGDSRVKEWQWTEKDIDRKIKGILEEVLELKLSDWFEKYY